MSQLKVDNITDEEGTGAPNFSNGVALSGTPLSGVASEAEAQAGTDNAHVMTPLRVRNALNASGSAPIFACRAWVNFNGTGTVAIRAAGNVSSVTDNGTGDYTVNFTTVMPDANYAVAGMSTGVVNHEQTAVAINRGFAPNTSSLRIRVGTTGGAASVGQARDSTHTFVAIFR